MISAMLIKKLTEYIDLVKGNRFQVNVGPLLSNLIIIIQGNIFVGKHIHSEILRFALMNNIPEI